jgi:methionyl-tRNA formyltransferase
VTARTRTVFLGTGAFAVPVVEALVNHARIDLAAVVTAPARPGSRGRVIDPPVAQWANDRQLPTLRPGRLRSPDSIAALRELRPELLVLADYGQIVPGELLDLPRHGALNLHPSLLPRHRGATPISAAILAGDAESGVTLMKMDEGLDTGPIVAQWRHALTGHETAPELETDLADQAATLLDATLEHWLQDEIEPEPQPHTGATVTRPLRREDGRLDPARAAAELERQVRAYQPWPGSFVETNGGHRIAIQAAHQAGPRDKSTQPGTLVPTAEGGLALAAADGLLELVEVVPAGGRAMTGAELLRGRSALAGSHTVLPAEAGP